MNYQEERMKDLVGNLPQNRNVDWDNVVPVIDFQFSDHPDPVKARRKNIKRAMKTLKPVKRFTGLFGYKYNSKPFQCVVSGVDCRNMDYGDLFDQYFRDHSDPSTDSVSPMDRRCPRKRAPYAGNLLSSSHATLPFTDRMDGTGRE